MVAKAAAATAAGPEAEAPASRQLGQHRLVVGRVGGYPAAKLLAVARIIVGPPMSMFSIASACIAARDGLLQG